MKKQICFIVFAILVWGCSNDNFEMSNIEKSTIEKTVGRIIDKGAVADPEQLRKGVQQCAALWKQPDGSTADFITFCQENFCYGNESRTILFQKLSTAFELLFGVNGKADVELKFPVHLAGDDLTHIDYILGNYNPGAHFFDDMFANKVAFITILNFPHYSLKEKELKGENWSRQEWAYARMGDMFTERVPARVYQQMTEVFGDAENYIASYNIMMGHLLTEKGERLFPEDMVLLAHWNLRDEIKSNYADLPHAFEKQQMIYKVMEHIAEQTIPSAVINNPEYDWAPFSSKVYRSGKEVDPEQEGNVRYSHILNIFHTEQLLDRFSPELPSGILRNFEGGMEITDTEIEELFIHLISSPQVKKVARLIQERLGRSLEPFDIWYDGFKSRSSLSEEDLSRQTRARYPDPRAFKQDLPRMLTVLGFSPEKARYLSDRIVVEGARGSGHAWGAPCRWEPSRLRTRIGKDGMDYKGYNIAVHEFGHNVEQTFSLYNMDYYTMNGVPNTAFTETLAFIFQKRDLKLLGYPQKIDENTVLDIFWGAYEIMGVSLVDMYTWRWLYAHPEASAEDLKDAVLKIAKEVWNLYYEPVLGTKDSPILAIYSHMINSPMYLPNYPFGHIIEFQLEEHLAGMDDKEFALEIERIYTLGKLTPQKWMKEAVGEKVSTDPLLKAIDKIIL